jgi:hypothetical protein
MDLVAVKKANGPADLAPQNLLESTMNFTGTSLDMQSN